MQKRKIVPPIYKVTNAKEEREREGPLPWRWSVGGHEGIHLPLPIPNHPQSVEYHCDPDHPNRRIHQLQQRLYEASHHSRHCDPNSRTTTSIDFTPIESPNPELGLGRNRVKETNGLCLCLSLSQCFFVLVQ